MKGKLFWSLYCYWAIPEKKKKKEEGGGGVKDLLFKNPTLKFLGFLLYLWKFQRKQDFFAHRNSIKLCYNPQKF